MVRLSIVPTGNASPVLAIGKTLAVAARFALRIAFPLALMILKTLETLGPLHGYGIARRIERTSGHELLVNYGTIYPALLKLEAEGSITSEWGVSDNNRRAKFYALTRAGRKQIAKEEREWQKTTAILARFLSQRREV
jgi:transcriptional regulator